jgi:hypothetical protein
MIRHVNYNHLRFKTKLSGGFYLTYMLEGRKRSSFSFLEFGDVLMGGAAGAGGSNEETVFALIDVQ